MIHKRLPLLLLTVVVLGSSCKKWLDLLPETQVSADELFSTEEGFKESLNGVYIRASSVDLYGKELTAGTVEVLAQNYNYPSNDQEDVKYRQTGSYNYRDKDFIARRDAIWSGLYNAVTNCNLLLSYIDGARNVFSGNNYPIVKGEALALRAYFHFDLLRLFAVSYKNNPQGRGIPYVTISSNEITPMSDVSEVIAHIIADLDEAKQLLKDTDPIRLSSYKVGYPANGDTTQSTELASPQLFLQNRRHRMNYYAVCATLARVYLYISDKENALNNALEVINSRKFPWVRPADFQEPEEGLKDRILYPELIFGWYVPGSVKPLSDLFDRRTSSVSLDIDAGNTIYETSGVGGEDMRFRQWFNEYSSPSGRAYELLKYKRNAANSDVNRHAQMAPALRLSEMFYIAAESSYANDPVRGAAYVDSVRAHRGIGAGLTVPSEALFMDELVKECRKEWYAEGQIFYMYKRLNRSIAGQQGRIIPASDNIFVLPLPDDEISYGGR